MTTIIRAARVFDGIAGSPHSHWAVVVEGSSIASIGPDARIVAPAGASLVELGDVTLLPGLIDAHTHLASNYNAPAAGDTGRTLVRMALHSMRNIQQDLAGGVTTLRCMGDPDFMDADFKEQVRQGVLVGPNLVVSTRGIQASNGTMSAQFAVVADGPEAIRKVIRENLSHGADVIKLFVSGGIKTDQASACFYSLEEIRAAVDEAHRFGKPVGAHVYGGGVAIQNCIEAGIDMIEHGALINSREIEELCKRGVWMVISVNVYRHLTRLGMVSEERLAQIEESLQMALRAGVLFAVATDGMHGALSEDLEILEGWGVAPVDALAAATRRAAEVCGLSDRLGTLEPGKVADLIAVRGDPAQDLRCLREPMFVMRGGQDVTAAARMIRAPLSST